MAHPTTTPRLAAGSVPANATFLGSLRASSAVLAVVWVSLVALGDGTEVLAENPRNQGELFLAADGTHHGTELPVEFGGAQQVRVGIADFGDSGAAGVDLSQQGTAPKRVVHHLSLQSHGDQSTSALLGKMCDRPVTPLTAGWNQLLRSQRGD